MCAVPQVPPDQPHQGAQATARFGRWRGSSQAIGLCRAAEHFVCFRASGNGAVMTGVGWDPAISRHPGEGRDPARHALPDEALSPGLRRGDGKGGFRDYVSLPLMTKSGWEGEWQLARILLRQQVPPCCYISMTIDSSIASLCPGRRFAQQGRGSDIRVPRASFSVRMSLTRLLEHFSCAISAHFLFEALA